MTNEDARAGWKDGLAKLKLWFDRFLLPFVSNSVFICLDIYRSCSRCSHKVRKSQSVRKQHLLLQGKAVFLERFRCYVNVPMPPVIKIAWICMFQLLVSALSKYYLKMVWFLFLRNLGIPVCNKQTQCWRNWFLCSSLEVCWYIFERFLILIVAR